MSAPSIMLGTVGLNLLARSPGVVARTMADMDAPEPVREQTMKRETLHLVGAVAFSALAIPFSKRFAPVLFKHAGFLSKIDKEVGISAVATGLGATATEVFSRAFFPVKHDNEITQDTHSYHEHDDDDYEDRKIGSRLNITSSDDPPSFSQAFSTPTTPARPLFPASQMFNAPMNRSSFSVSV